MEWTDSQTNSINAKGNVVVTAAAGSGKTAVLVERVIRKLCNEKEPISADRLLIVTFTNAAAAEMRQRIEKALADKCSAEPGNTLLLKQRLLIPSADICTIDSFCIRLVRNNFSVLGISPDFKIADNVVADKIKDSVIKSIFDERLTAGDSSFFELLKILNSEYGTGNAENFIKEVVEYSSKFPQSCRWILNAAEEYNPDNMRKSAWIKAYLDSFVLKLRWHLNELSACRKELLSHSDTEKKFGFDFDCAIDFIKKLISLIEKSDWDGLYNSLSSPPTIIKVFKLAKAYDPYLFSRVENTYKPFKETFKEMSKCFDRPLDDMRAEFELCYKIVKGIAEIATEYYQKYREKLIEKSTLTFNIIEQMTLELLADCNEDGSFSPSALSVSLSNNYDEIMVDEYQDINDLQGLIFEILSDNCKKLFTVGDVKQSIYGFRGSNPQIFSRRSDDAKFYEETLSSETCKRIVLSNNFRSRKGVCDFINAFFKVILSKESGDIEYDANEMLYPAAQYPENGFAAVEAHLISPERGVRSTEAEAEYLADYITNTIKEDAFLRDKNTGALRKAEYGDFSILYRGATNLGYYIKALKKRGIPVSLSTGDFFKTTEIMTAISLIKAVENPLNNIPMLAVMMSPIFGFTENDVAELKCRHSSKRLFTLALLKSKENDSKCLYLTEKISYWRKQAACLSTPDFVSFLLSDSGYCDMVLSMSDGERRYSDLVMLENLAETYFSENSGDLSGFISFLSYTENSRAKLTPVSVSQRDAVSFTTMHGSKGLQFPIAVIIGCGAQFSGKTEENKKSIIFSEKLGFAFRYVDDEANKMMKSFSFPIVKKIIDHNRVEEEMRLLYVAMTRAEERLVLFNSVESDFANNLDGWTEYINDAITPEGRFAATKVQEANGYFSWLIPVILQTKQGRALLKDNAVALPQISKHLQDIDIKVVHKVFGLDETAKSKQEVFVNPDVKLVNKLNEIFSYHYPYSEQNKIEIKTSVSALTKRNADRSFCATKRPAFVSSKGLSPTERGTALHKFMQFSVFKNLLNDISGEVERLYEFGYISRAEADAIDIEKVSRFVNDEIFDRMLKADSIYREQRFLLDVKAKEIFSDISADSGDITVIVQGAVDCLFIEGDHIVLIDFKTDRTNDIEFLLEHYSEQLKTYCVAAEKMFNKSVTECYIYSLHMGKRIKVE